MLEDSYKEKHPKPIPIGEQEYGYQCEDVFLIKEWDMEHLFGYVDTETRSGCDLKIWNKDVGCGYIPVD